MTAFFASIFNRFAPLVDFCSFLFVEETAEKLSVQQNVIEPPQTSVDRGVMITVIDKGGLGYAAPSDLSEAGLRAAAARAQHWAQLTAGRAVADFSKFRMPQPSGSYRTAVRESPAALSKRDKFEL